MRLSWLRCARPLPPRAHAQRVGMLVALALCALLCPVLGCGSSPDRPEMKPGPAISGLNLSGKWYSADFGDMELVQEGGRVTGRYSHPRGPEHDGTIRGEVVGDLLRAEWIQPGNSGAGVFPMRGRATFRITDGGAKLDGRWGYDEDDYAGGVWRAEKSVYER